MVAALTDTTLLLSQKAGRYDGIKKYEEKIK